MTGCAVIAACLLLWTAPAFAEEPTIAGDRLAFELPDVNGDTVSTTDPRLVDKVLLVTLWGTWCPPCLSEIPTFNDLQARLGDERFAVVAIAFERKGDADARQAKLRDFVRKHRISYLVLDGGLTSEFSAALPMIDHVKGLPVEILIDGGGGVVDIRNGFGYSEKWARELEKRIGEVMAQSR